MCGEHAQPKNSLPEFTAKENESVLSASQESATRVSEDYVTSPLVQTAAYSLLIPVSLSICFVHRDLRRLTSSFPQTKEQLKTKLVMTAGKSHSWLYFQLPIKRELLFQAAFKSLL